MSDSEARRLEAQLAAAERGFSSHGDKHKAHEVRREIEALHKDMRRNIETGEVKRRNDRAPARVF